MPRVIDRLASTEGPGMIPDDHAVLSDHDSLRIGMDIDRAPDRRPQDGVFVVVEPIMVAA